jgi:hypothetical protein
MAQYLADAKQEYNCAVEELNEFMENLDKE